MVSIHISVLIVPLIFSWTTACSMGSPQILDSCKFVPHGTAPLLISDLEKDGWLMVFRATAGNGHNAYNAWANGSGTTQVKPTAMARTHDNHYRDNGIDDWSNRNIQYIKVGLYKNSVEVGYMVFDGTGSTKLNWFSKYRLLHSSWSDMTSDAAYNIFSMSGWVRAQVTERRFHINVKYGGCPKDIGYLVVVERGQEGCPWDQHLKYPQILYSDYNGAEHWNNRMFGRADYMAFFVKTSNL